MPFHSYGLEFFIDFPDDPEYWNKQYCKTLSDPKSWIRSAMKLIYVLGMLRERVISFIKASMKGDHNSILEIYEVYLMIAAFVIENLLKALIVKKLNYTPESFKDGLPKILKTHNLNSLASKVKNEFQTTEAGEELFTRLSEYAIWIGRYPMPLESKYLKPKNLTRRLKNIAQKFHGIDVRNIDEAISQLFMLLGKDLPYESMVQPLPPEYQDWENYSIAGPFASWDEKR